MLQSLNNLLLKLFCGLFFNEIDFKDSLIFHIISKVVVLERYIQHTEKAENKSNKKKNASSSAKAKSPRRSSSKNTPLSRENSKTGFTIRKNSKASNFSDSHLKPTFISTKTNNLQVGLKKNSR